MNGFVDTEAWTLMADEPGSSHDEPEAVDIDLIAQQEDAGDGYESDNSDDWGPGRWTKEFGGIM